MSSTSLASFLRLINIASDLEAHASIDDCNMAATLVKRKQLFEILLLITLY